MAGTKAQVTGQLDCGAHRGGHRQAQLVQRLHLAESLPQAVGLNCGFAHHASPFLLCRGSRSGGDRYDNIRYRRIRCQFIRCRCLVICWPTCQRRFPPIELRLSQTARAVERAFDEALGKRRHPAGLAAPAQLEHPRARQATGTRRGGRSVRGHADASPERHGRPRPGHPDRDVANRRVQVVALTEAGEAAFGEVRCHSSAYWPIALARTVTLAVIGLIPGCHASSRLAA
jgi:hypothetical protein